jgi:hypothetical protein
MEMDYLLDWTWLSQLCGVAANNENGSGEYSNWKEHKIQTALAVR